MFWPSASARTRFLFTRRRAEREVSRVVLRKRSSSFPDSIPFVACASAKTRFRSRRSDCASTDDGRAFVFLFLCALGFRSFTSRARFRFRFLVVGSTIEGLPCCQSGKKRVQGEHERLCDCKRGIPVHLARSAHTHRNGHLASVPGKRSTGDPPVAHEQGSDRDRIHLSRQNLKIHPPRHTNCLLDRCARHADPHPNRSSPLVCYRAFSSSVSGSAFVCLNPPHILLATQRRHLQTQQSGFAPNINVSPN